MSEESRHILHLACSPIVHFEILSCVEKLNKDLMKSDTACQYFDVS